jgi:hypothetical protein
MRETLLAGVALAGVMTLSAHVPGQVGTVAAETEQAHAPQSAAPTRSDDARIARFLQ